MKTGHSTFPLSGETLPADWASHEKVLETLLVAARDYKIHPEPGALNRFLDLLDRCLRFPDRSEF